MEEDSENRASLKRPNLLDCDSNLLYQSTFFEKTSRNKGYASTALHNSTTCSMVELLSDNVSDKLHRDTSTESKICGREAFNFKIGPSPKTPINEKRSNSQSSSNSKLMESSKIKLKRKANKSQLQNPTIAMFDFGKTIKMSPSNMKQ